MSTKTKLGIVALVIMFVIIMDHSPGANPPAPEAAQSASAPDPKLDAQRDTTYILINSLYGAARNPDSLKFGEVRAMENGNVVCAVYRAQNGFGGMNLERAVYVAHDTAVKTNLSANQYKAVCKWATVDVSQWARLYQTTMRP